MFALLAGVGRGWSRISRNDRSRTIPPPFLNWPLPTRSVKPSGNRGVISSSRKPPKSSSVTVDPSGFADPKYSSVRRTGSSQAVLTGGPASGALHSTVDTTPRRTTTTQAAVVRVRAPIILPVTTTEPTSKDHATPRYSRFPLLSARESGTFPFRHARNPPNRPWGAPFPVAVLLYSVGTPPACHGRSLPPAPLGPRSNPGRSSEHHTKMDWRCRTRR
jgi:hypothetical protein